MKFSIIFVTCCVAFAVASVSDAKSEQRRDYHELSVKSSAQVARPAVGAHSKRMASDNDQDNRIPDEPQTKVASEIESDRINISEPYKSIIQTTARFALAQTQVTKHVNIDTAMNLLNDAGYFLSKPVVLVKAIKLVVFGLATLIFSLMFFPGAHKFIETAWQDPMGALNLDRYLTNGLEERSVLAALGSKTDETLSRVGLQDNSCRQRSICYMGEIMRCSFPQTAETITKFASENFSSSNIKENVYARAFISGFVDKNCTSVGAMSQQDTNSCLGNFFNSILSGVERHRNGGHSKRRKK